ncbi:hypothetical protein [Streptomyces sp. NPDC001415]
MENVDNMSDADLLRLQREPYEVHFTRTPIQLIAGYGWQRLVAFRVDAEGVLLGGTPVRHKAHTAFVPWTDIEALVIWRLHTAGQGINHIGARRRAGAPALPGPNTGLTPEKSASLAPHVEYDLMLSSRAISLWRLHPGRLQIAVDTFAPQVKVLVYGSK